ncbi:hypothetical protein AB0C22_23585 [Micromonospora sp. NPDC048894]
MIRTEDAALTLDGNWLPLTHKAGTLHKHRPTRWNNYGFDDVFT